MALQGYELQLAERLLIGSVISTDDVIATFVSSGDSRMEDKEEVQRWEETLKFLKLEKWYIDYGSLYEDIKTLSSTGYGSLGDTVDLWDGIYGRVEGRVYMIDTGVVLVFTKEINRRLTDNVSEDTWRELFMIEGDTRLMYATKKIPYLRKLWNDRELWKEKLKINAGEDYMNMFKSSGDARRDWNDWSTGRRAIRDNIVTDHPIQNLQEDITNQLVGGTLEFIRELVQQSSGDRLVAALSIFAVDKISSQDIQGFEFKIYEREDMYYGVIHIPKHTKVLLDTWYDTITGVRFYGGVIMVLVKQ